LCFLQTHPSCCVLAYLDPYVYHTACMKLRFYWCCNQDVNAVVNCVSNKCVGFGSCMSLWSLMLYSVWCIFLDLFLVYFSWFIFSLLCRLLFFLIFYTFVSNLH
jgi:hypothetical protein